MRVNDAVAWVHDRGFVETRTRGATLDAADYALRATVTYEYYRAQRALYGGNITEVAWRPVGGPLQAVYAVCGAAIAAVRQERGGD